MSNKHQQSEEKGGVVVSYATSTTSTTPLVKFERYKWQIQYQTKAR